MLETFKNQVALSKFRVISLKRISDPARVQLFCLGGLKILLETSIDFQTAFDTWLLWAMQEGKYFNQIYLAVWALNCSAAQYWSHCQQSQIHLCSDRWAFIQGKLQTREKCLGSSGYCWKIDLIYEPERLKDTGKLSKLGHKHSSLLDSMCSVFLQTARLIWSPKRRSDYWSNGGFYWRSGWRFWPEEGSNRRRGGEERNFPHY